MKKFLAIVLVLTIVLGLCAACGGNNEQQNNNKAEGKVTVQIGLAASAKVSDYDNNALTKWLEEQTGVDIEIVEYAGGTDVATQISATISARQELPDILWGISINEETVNTYGREGYFVDLRPYYEDTEGASKIFWDRMAECMDEYQQEYVLQLITDTETGGMYSVPTVETSLVDTIYSMAWINTEWLDKLSLKAPTNTEELYTVLKAFKDNDCNGNGDPTDEIPLYGKDDKQAHVISWLLNMFIYYNPSHLWQDYNGDGKLEAVYTQDKYREGLAFINKLYKEGLLSKTVYTDTNKDMKLVTTPNSGVARCGIFTGHLSIHTTKGNEVLYQYESLKSWGSVCERELSAKQTCYITETAKNRGIVDECFNLLMTMWSWDGAMRIRYGEYGVNWTEADEGAKSDYGLDAEYKILSPVPSDEQQNYKWGSNSGTLNHYAEGETAQTGDGVSEWDKTKYKMHAECRANFEWAMENVNPQYLADPFLEKFIMTAKEEEQIDMKKTNFDSIISSYVKNFVTGDQDMDINNDAKWKEFQDALKAEGMEDIVAMYQKCYERQK